MATVYNGARLSKPVTIAQGRISNLIFDIGEFPQPAAQNQQAQAPATPRPQNQNQAQQPPAPTSPPRQVEQVQVPAQQGVLQLIAVSGVDQQPLKVNFVVSTLNGQRLKAADNVSVTEVALPPQDVLVDINYADMRGQERIQVKAGEPTVYTFTITPNQPAAPINQVQQQAPGSLEEC
ncbi:MAG: hypothetical protein R3E89_10045 [Thiolinea sp.]